MSIASERLATLIQRELVTIINTYVKVSGVDYINLTSVKVTKDKSFATVLYTILKDEAKTIAKVTDELKSKKGIIRIELAKKINNLRRIPDLIFNYDEALSYSNHINKLISKLDIKDE